MTTRVAPKILYPSTWQASILQGCSTISTQGNFCLIPKGEDIFGMISRTKRNHQTGQVFDVAFPCKVGSSTWVTLHIAYQFPKIKPPCRAGKHDVVHRLAPGYSTAETCAKSSITTYHYSISQHCHAGLVFFEQHLAIWDPLRSSHAPRGRLRLPQTVQGMVGAWAARTGLT